MLLLVLLLLLRFMLDPWDTTYYPLPFLFALLTWEVMTREEPPVLTLAASFAVWFVFEWLPDRADADVQAFVFLALTLPTLRPRQPGALRAWTLSRQRPALTRPALASGA